MRVCILIALQQFDGLLLIIVKSVLLLLSAGRKTAVVDEVYSIGSGCLCLWQPDGTVGTGQCFTASLRACLQCCTHDIDRDLQISAVEALQGKICHTPNTRGYCALNSQCMFVCRSKLREPNLKRWQGFYDHHLLHYVVTAASTLHLFYILAATNNNGSLLT